jgi:hypothetical protein
VFHQFHGLLTLVSILVVALHACPIRLEDDLSIQAIAQQSIVQLEFSLVEPSLNKHRKSLTFFFFFFFFFFTFFFFEVSFLLLSRHYAAGARQGSSIANVKMVQYGRFQIPVRLLKRWLEKRERTRVIDTDEEKVENKMVTERIAATKGVHYAANIKGRSTAEIAAKIEQRWAAMGPVKRSWLMELMNSAQSPADWALVQEGWIRFAEQLRITDGNVFSRVFLLAAIRSNSLPALVELLRTPGCVRVIFSTASAKLLLYAVPAELVTPTLGSLLHRQPQLAQSRRLLTMALCRTEEPGAAALAPAVARLIAQLPSGDPKPAITASALLRARLTLTPDDATNIAAEALKLNTVDGRAIAVLAALVQGIGSPDGGVAVATAHWANSTTDVSYISSLFGRRAAFYPQVKDSLRQFLLGLLNNDATVVDNMLREGEEWSVKRASLAAAKAAEHLEDDDESSPQQPRQRAQQQQQQRQ